MKVEAPERIWAVASLGMVGSGRWVTQGSENPHGNVEYVRADKLEELAAENEHQRQMLANQARTIKEQQVALADPAPSGFTIMSKEALETIENAIKEDREGKISAVSALNIIKGAMKR